MKRLTKNIDQWIEGVNLSSVAFWMDVVIAVLIGVFIVSMYMLERT